MDDDEYGEDDDVMVIPAREMSALDVAVIALDCFGDFIHGIKFALCQHANWKITRRQMENEMRAEIEFITSGGTSDV